MQTLSVGATSLVLDDDTASAIVWYTTLLAQRGRTECVEVNGYDLDREAVVAQLVLGPSVPVAAVTAHMELPDPDNDAVRARIKDDSDRLENPPSVQPDDAPPVSLETH